MTDAHNLHYCPYKHTRLHDIKYISDGSRLKAPTAASWIELTVVQSSATNYIPATISPRPQEPVRYLCIELVK